MYTNPSVGTTNNFESGISVLVTGVESYHCTLPFFSPVTFNHHVGGDAGGRGGGGRGGEEGDYQSRGGENRLAIVLWNTQRREWRLLGAVILVPAALQEHQLLVVLPLRHEHIIRPAHLACLYHFVLTLKGGTKVLELVLNVFH